MPRRQVVFGAAAVVAVLLAGCSKSEDVPAGRRLFGDPPQIEVVEVTPESEQKATASCDATESVIAFLCENARDEFGNWYYGPPQEYVFSGPVSLTGTYTSATLKVKVSDPQGVGNLLFVGASYVDPHCPPENTCTESTIVLFDDGSENRFDQAQKDAALGGSDCVIDETLCTCQSAYYQVTSNDATKGDGIFTRALPFVSSSRLLLQDCVMRDHEQVPVAAIQGGETISFRIDAVDREGNVDTWDTNPTIHVLPTEQTSFSCTGDPCACCLAINPGTYIQECGGCTGLVPPPLGASLCSIFGGTNCKTSL